MIKDAEWVQHVEELVTAMFCAEVHEGKYIYRRRAKVQRQASIAIVQMFAELASHNAEPGAQGYVSERDRYHEGLRVIMLISIAAIKSAPAFCRQNS